MRTNNIPYVFTAFARTLYRGKNVYVTVLILSFYEI